MWRERETERERQRQRQRQTDRQTETDRQTDRDRDTETDRQTETDRATETETDRQRQRQTDRQRQRLYIKDKQNPTDNTLRPLLTSHPSLKDSDNKHTDALSSTRRQQRSSDTYTQQWHVPPSNTCPLLSDRVSITKTRTERERDHHLQSKQTYRVRRPRSVDTVAQRHTR